MKRDMENFVAKWMVCQQFKVDHMRPDRLHQEIKFLEWKWEVINMDFITGLPRSQN